MLRVVSITTALLVTRIADLCGSTYKLKELLNVNAWKGVEQLTMLSKDKTALTLC